MSKMNKHLAALRKKTKSESFATSGNTCEWISTGDYGLNRIISGDINKGIPSGKVVLFGGESSSGKSLIVAKVAVNALKMGFDHIFYFDSEGGALKSFFEAEGVNSEQIEHIRVRSVEDATVQILQTYEAIEKIKEEDPDSRFLCILDSLGALVSNKLIDDALVKNRQASDMGLTAKQKNCLMKSVMMPVNITNTSLLVVNHIYDDPAAMYASKIKQQSGGKGVQYAAHIAIQCHKKFEKNENKKTEGNEFKSNILRFLVTKNRDVKPFFESEMLLNFSTGIIPWFSLWEPAILYGFIIQHGAYFTVPSFSDKKLRRTEILSRDDIWETFLDDFNEKSAIEMTYGSSSNESAEDIAKEMIASLDEEDEEDV
jgi:RecA/RadA recombinase